MTQRQLTTPRPHHPPRGHARAPSIPDRAPRTRDLEASIGDALGCARPRADAPADDDSARESLAQGEDPVRVDDRDEEPEPDDVGRAAQEALRPADAEGD